MYSGHKKYNTKKNYGLGQFRVRDLLMNALQANFYVTLLYSSNIVSLGQGVKTPL